MTLRAVVIGLALGVVIAAVGYLNDWSLKLTYLAHNLVPASVYGLLLVGLLVANPLLRLTRCRPMRGAEWAVILALVTVAAVIPGPGLMWQFADVLVLPHYYQDSLPGWRKNAVVQYAPKVMLVDPGGEHETVVKSWISGLSPGQVPPIGRVPWHAWSRTLTFWLPFLALGFVAVICLMLVFHGQWAHRERLRYPVADFASQLIGGSGEGAFAPIFHNRRFWIGFSAALGLLLIHGYHAWNPDSIDVPLQFDFRAVANKFKEVQKIHRWTWMLQPRLFFIAIGFAYFVGSDVSFSVGISHLVFAVPWLILLERGISPAGHYLGGGVWNWQIFGSYLGMAVMIAYVGRRYYAGVLMRMFGLRRGEHVEPGVVWAGRFAVLSAAAMTVLLISGLGLHWLLAVLFVLLMGLVWVGIARINAETGLIIIQIKWHAVGVLLGLFGIEALGPNMLIVLAVLSAALAVDPRTSLMPMVANALRLGDTQGLRPHRVSRWLVLAVLAALAVGMFATIYVEYVFGDGGHFFWAKRVAQYPFEVLNQELPKIETRPQQHHAFDLAATRPSRLFLYSAGAGLALVLVCSFLRLRHTWWPIHPVLFMVWGTCLVIPLTASFLVGWLIKTAVTRFGGGEAYRRAKPLFVGLVAGEFVAGIFWAVVGLVYYLHTGTNGPVIRVHPF